jgi:hypothetical protein
MARRSPIKMELLDLVLIATTWLHCPLNHLKMIMSMDFSTGLHCGSWVENLLLEPEIQVLSPNVAKT